MHNVIAVQSILLALVASPCLAMRQKLAARASLSQASAARREATSKALRQFGKEQGQDGFAQTAEEGVQRVSNISCDSAAEGLSARLSEFTAGLNRACQATTTTTPPPPVPYHSWVSTKACVEQDGNLLRSVQQSSVEDCSIMCRGTSGCKFFSFSNNDTALCVDTTAKQCNLYSECKLLDSSSECFRTYTEERPEPQCDGRSCYHIHISLDGGHDTPVWRISRGMYGYEDDENARIPLSGPGVLTVIEMRTESNFDELRVGSIIEISGDVSNQIVDIPEGIHDMVWHSDSSITQRGWTALWEPTVVSIPESNPGQIQICPNNETDPQNSSACKYQCAGYFSDLDESRMRDLSTGLATAIMVLDEKRCMSEVLQQAEIQSKMAEVNEFKGRFTSYPEMSARMPLGLARLAAWQDALVEAGSIFVDRELFIPSEINSAWDCPAPCKSCSTSHNSLFKGAEESKFKCILSGSNSNNPPSLNEERIHCETPRRRMWRLWEFKTWCTVPGWVFDSFQNARIAAMVTCGTHSLLTTLRSASAMPDELLRTCMLVEQRMAVTMQELRAYKEFVGAEDDGEVLPELQYIFASFLATSTAQGLVGLRDASENSPPVSADHWVLLLQADNYTLVPQALMNDVPCQPPVSNREIMLGMFAAVAAVGSATMLAALAVFPLVLLTGFFFYVAAVSIILIPAIVVFGEPILALATVIGNAMVNIFTSVFPPVASSVYNFLAPQRPTKACPQGVLTIGSSAPLCIDGMDKLDAKRYTCPSDDSRSMVLSCEPEFNGVVALRGEPCPE